MGGREGDGPGPLSWPGTHFAWTPGEGLTLCPHRAGVPREGICVLWAFSLSQMFVHYSDVWAVMVRVFTARGYCWLCLGTEGQAIPAQEVSSLSKRDNAIQ